jgi:hypothetical protein
MYDHARENLMRARELILESVQKAGLLSVPDAAYPVELNLIIVFLLIIVLVLAVLMRRNGAPRQFKYLLEREELRNLSRVFSKDR